MGDIIRNDMQSKGVILYGSEWTGWVPADHCGGGGSLDASSYSISNLVIKGSIVKGPDVSLCGGGPNPVPAPAPAPAPTPSSPCTGGSLSACIESCPSTSYQACVGRCVDNCPGSFV